MRSFLLATAVIATTMLAACTYTYTKGGTTVIFEEHPDGRKTMTIQEGDEQEEIRINGMSNREIRRLIPVPRLDGQDLSGQDPTPIDYRYEYRFDVYDTNDDYIDTVAVETFDEFVEMIPVVFQLGGLPVPSQADIDDFAAEMAIWWIDPETDWHYFN